MATTFPKIYSLSTVGVRQHYNSEYLFHAVRTDFTGGNGLGKSIIADLMQLIIVPRRDMWKPGTEGIGKDERRVEGIPLNKEYIQYAYAFLNIERKQGQFLTIGVYISKTPRIPVRPFIIQAGNNFEGGSLSPFSRPLHPSDFMNESKTIFDLRELAKHLKEKHSLHMKDFFQTEGIMQYYDLLYKNNILPVNLTKPDNLKTYSKVIQSFARAKSLDITNSKSLQNFLFEDNEEIKRTFEEQKDQLHSLIKQYRENYHHTQELQQKQKKLLSLLETHRKSVLAKEEFLKSNALFASSKYTDALNRHENNKKHIDTSDKNLKKQKKELEKVTEELYKYYTNLLKVCTVLREKYDVLLKNYSDETILARKLEADTLRDKINLLNSLHPIVKTYGSVEKIEAKLSEQQSFREKKNDLQKLHSISSFDDFEKSLYAKGDFSSASKHFLEKLSELPDQIEELETLVELFEGTRDDSFFHWAIQNNKAITKEQESVLMYLKELPIGKPEEFVAGTRYIENPSALLNSFEKDGKGIWVTFGELREFAPLIQKQRFTHPKNFKTILEKDTKEIKSNLAEAHEELAIIQRLSDELSAIGFNQELSDIYRKKEEIENYTVDNSLNEEKISLIKENWDDIQKLETLQAEFSTIDNEAIELAKKQTDIKNKMNSAKLAHDQCEYEFTKLKLEINVSVVIEEEDFSSKKIESLDKTKEKYEIKLRSLTESKIWAEKYIIATEGELRGYRSSEPVYQQQMEEALVVFNEKKQLLESETGIVFEPTLITGELSENIIERLEKKSEELLEAYHEEFTRVAEAFDETKGDKNPELITDKYNFRTLVNILCGKLGLEGLGPELERLNEELKKFGDLQLTIILDVFKKVEVQYNAFRKLITELNFFFKDNRISGVYNFQVDFNERRDISVDWIRRMREHAKHQRLSAKLFITAEDETSPENLILNIAKALSDVGDCEISDLLDPKFYFDLRVGLYDELGARYPGSGGEAYTALALLCIGRMSVIQRDKNRTGVRFIIIEELSNIDDTNFGLFPEIAKMFGYQLLTMTPKPFGSYSESEWYLHMLIRGKDKNINYQPMSFFRTRMGKQRLEEYMGDGTIVTKVVEETPTVNDVATVSVHPVGNDSNGINETETVAEIPTVVTLSEVEASIPNEEVNDTISDAETIIEAEIASETSTEIKVEEVKDDVPELPQISDELQQERKQEFLGLGEDGKVEEEKKDENQNSDGINDIQS